MKDPRLKSQQHFISAEKFQVKTGLWDGNVTSTQFKSFDQRLLLEFENFYSVGPEGILVDGSILADSQQLSYDKIHPRWFPKFRRQSNRNIIENAILLAGKNFSNEGHFVYQHLPRLLTVLRSMPNLDPEKWTLLVNPGMKHKTQNWLYFYDLPLFNVREIDKYIHPISGIYASQPRSRTDILNKNDLENWGKCANTTNKICEHVVYIKRGEKAKRRLLNEKQIISCLRNIIAKVTVIDYDKWSIPLIKSAIKEATLIIGPSGMGLAPSILNRSTSIFVITNKYDIYNWATRFATPAALSGNLGATLSAQNPNGKANFHDDFIFPEGVFRGLIIKLLESI